MNISIFNRQDQVLNGAHGENSWRNIFPTHNPAVLNAMSDHKFNISHKVVNTVDPADDKNFDQADENDRNRCSIPIEQLQPIHSALQNKIENHLSNGVSRLSINQ